MRNLGGTRIATRPEQHPEPTDVGTLLKRHRMRARLTQAELAGLSTVSLRTIRNLEAGRGQNPRPATVRLLADGLRLGPQAFETFNAALGRGQRGAVLGALVCKVPACTRLTTGQLLGRQNEMSSSLGAIRTGAGRVITLGGFGGVGKSRLAAGIVEAARLKFSMPWLWVPLSAASAASDASDGSVADRFSQWAGEFAAGADGAVDDLVALVAAQPFLLVLDDLPEDSSALDAVLADILQRCPRLVVIETTRQMVERTNRALMPVKPLALDGPAESGTARMSPALELLLSHARTACPDLESTGKHIDSFSVICRALDGLPRAIENAASWLAVCHPSDVAEMARSDPFSIGCGGNPGASEDRWAYEALADALNCLPASAYSWLEMLSAVPDPWTLEEAAVMTRQGPVQMAKSMYDSLMLGLIRPVGAHDGEPRVFTVLNHVKSFLA